MDEREHLDAWWETLDDERRQALLDADDADPPGWAVASVVAKVLDREGGEVTGNDPTDAKGHLVQALVEFLEDKRAGGR